MTRGSPKEVSRDGFSGCSMVHQHDVNRADVAVVFVPGLWDSGNADGVPFAHENLANPCAILS